MIKISYYHKKRADRSIHTVDLLKTLNETMPMVLILIDFNKRIHVLVIVITLTIFYEILTEWCYFVSVQRLLFHTLPNNKDNF